MKRECRLLMGLLMWLFASSTLCAQWSLISQSKPGPLGSGAWEVTKKVRGGGSDAEMHLIFFDSNRCTLQVLDNPRGSGALDRRLSATGALAGCNGGYFTPGFAPVGLMISDGKRIGAFEKSSLLTGVLMVRNGRPLLLWREEFSDSKGVTDLLQCGPRLVIAGKPAAGLDDGAQRPRTFVFTDTAGHWAIGCCRAVSLREQAAILVSPKIINEMKVERALNLDGGSSSGLWWKDQGGTEHYERERAVVRNFLAVLPRR